MISSDYFTLNFERFASGDWAYEGRKCATCFVGAPVFEIDHETVAVSGDAGLPVLVGGLPQGGQVYSVLSVVASQPGLSIELQVEVHNSPIARFRYVLRSDRPRRLTKSGKVDKVRYLSLDLRDASSVTEVRFSEFNELVHSYCLSERPIENRHFASEQAVMGPMLVYERPQGALLVAYEHGSQSPNAFLQFRLGSDRRVALQAVKANYCDGQLLDDEHPYETIWFHIGAHPESIDGLADSYRDFMLKYQTANLESRKPYLFYNTWNFQERNKAWYGKAYLESMNQGHIMAEIEIAHQLGIEVFVLDTGWYEKTGDWQVDRTRFPDGLKSIKARLDEYDMKLGLWFDPTAAAASSAMLKSHKDCVMTWQGKKSEPHPIWESEESFNICLVSRYHEAFADELIRLVREVGVTYFKWDAIGQYGCDGTGHGHGGEENSYEDRAENYAFELGRAMSKVVDKLCAACPEAIVDFDITEGGRYVGLGFLSSGKYFLINNGPYYRSLDDPKYAPGGGMGSNVYVFPGPARGWICRTPLTFDKWIPSVLYLTHYLPDDGPDSQWINVASMVLGQNGIWGDLLALSPDGVALIGDALAKYKSVRDDITASALIRTGPVGGSPEVYEKINPASGRGVVSVFSSAKGTYTIVTERKVDRRFWASDGAAVEIDHEGRATITAAFDGPSARLVFFGVGN